MTAVLRSQMPPIIVGETEASANALRQEVSAELARLHLSLERCDAVYKQQKAMGENEPPDPSWEPREFIRWERRRIDDYYIKDRSNLTKQIWDLRMKLVPELKNVPPILLALIGSHFA